MQDSREHPVGRPAIASATSGGVDQGGDAGDDDLVVDELLVEDVSIDGMCGVY